MAQFEPALQRTLLNEGGYANNPSDRGGETYEGISFNNWPNWEGWALIHAHKQGDLLNADSTLQIAVIQFYRTNFWRYDLLDSQLVANKIFDLAVNVGAVHAHKIAQRAVNVNADGILGPRTISALNSTSQGVLLLDLRTKAAEYHKAIVISHPEDAQFLAGWLARDAA